MSSRFKTAADFRKSLEIRLKRTSEETGEELQRLRRKVAFDRLLVRIFEPERTEFYLKGGYAMELRFRAARATKDLDLTTSNRHDDPSQEIFKQLQTLAARDLGDHFVYRVGESILDLTNAPYGGARYPVDARVADRTFVKFHLDVGADSVVTDIESQPGPDWLAFADIPAPIIPMISIEQQFAEKLHAYSRPQTDRINTRVKDLVDLLLLVDMKGFDPAKASEAIDRVFGTRGTHTPPAQLAPPPPEWEPRFTALSQECGLDHTLQTAFEKISKSCRPLLTG